MITWFMRRWRPRVPQPAALAWLWPRYDGAAARHKLTKKAKLRPHNTMRKKLPDGVELLQKIPARAAGAKVQGG